MYATWCTILTTFKCALHWRWVLSHCCAAITASISRTLSAEKWVFFCFSVCTIWHWKASHCFSWQFCFYWEGAACGQVLWTLGVSALQSSAWSELPEAPDSSLREAPHPQPWYWPASLPPLAQLTHLCSTCLFSSQHLQFSRPCLFFKVALSCLIHLRPSPPILPRSCSQWI